MRALQAYRETFFGANLVHWPPRLLTNCHTECHYVTTLHISGSTDLSDCRNSSTLSIFKRTLLVHLDKPATIYHSSAFLLSYSDRLLFRPTATRRFVVNLATPLANNQTTLSAHRSQNALNEQ